MLSFELYQIVCKIFLALFFIFSIIIAVYLQRIFVHKVKHDLIFHELNDYSILAIMFLILYIMGRLLERKIFF